ncbi:MAG TPA: PEP-CTERM sorting domain-containing protein [Bryobacteraceae bacterium]|jgi:hypothetical protein|nr:PEP-CTERM sorting domain-containing protein [Bryobacteraceae bacterium]
MVTLRSLFLSALALSASAAPVFASNIVLNPDFYANGLNGYMEIADWTSSSSGVNTGSQANTGNAFWDNGTVPVGTTSVGFIQVNPSEGQFPAVPTDSLSQDLSLDIGAVYTLSYLENARAFNGISPEVEVLVGGNVVVPQSIVAPVGPVSSLNPFQLVTTTFTATASTETLQFLVSQQNSNDDATFLVTNVNVSAAPEPGTTGLMFSALGMLGFAVRRFAR